jgi:hypothetical protein
MPKSSMMMDTAEIASMEAEMAPDMGEPVGGGAGSTENPADEPREPRAKKAKPEPDLEFVAEPEEEGGDEAKPEKKADAKAEKKAEPDEVQSNQLKALHEERTRRKEVQKALETERIQNAAARAALETKVNMINEAIARNQQRAQAQPQVDQDPLPPPEDVIGRQEWLIRRQTQQAQQQAAARQQWEAQQRQAVQQTQAQQEENRVIAETRASFQRAVQEDPSTWDAYQYVQGARIRQLREFGVPEHQIKDALVEEERNAVKFARSQGKSYHQVIRTFADTMGWVPPSQRQAQQAAQQAPRDANGRFAPTNGNGQEDNAGKLERLAKTVDASDSLSNSGGSPGGNGRISLDTIDKMSPGELQALVRKLEKGGPGGVDKALAKMMGM